MGCESGHDRDEEDEDDEDVDENGVVEITDDERDEGDVEVDWSSANCEAAAAAAAAAAIDCGFSFLMSPCFFMAISRFCLRHFALRFLNHTLKNKNKQAY